LAGLNSLGTKVISLIVYQMLSPYDISVTVMNWPLDVVVELNEKISPGVTAKYSPSRLAKIGVPAPPNVVGSVELLPVASILIQPASCVATRT
jgi:hypothetical protein